MSKRKSKPSRSDRLRRESMQRAAGRKYKHLSDNELAALVPIWSGAFLCTPAWRALRQKVLATHGRTCMCCGYTPKNPAHINVDHVKPRKYYPELALVESNLQVLCGRCNKRKGNCDTDYRKPQETIACGEFSDESIGRLLRQFC